MEVVGGVVGRDKRKGESRKGEEDKKQNVVQDD